MKLIEVVTAYVVMQRSLGLRFKAADRLLRQFAHEMGNIGIADVRPDAVVAFLQGAGALTATWRLKYNVLSGLYRFAISRGYSEACPLPANVPKLPPSQTPYVYSTGELRRLIDATPLLYNYRCRQQASMYRTLILLLYGSGLRIGEVLRLTILDVDLIERVIIVRDTKFFKTRLVPIGPQLSTELAAHIVRRRNLPMPAGENSRLFTSRTGRGWPYSQVITLFQRLRHAAQIKCSEGERHPPRLHDLRHYLPFLTMSSNSGARSELFEESWPQSRSAQAITRHSLLYLQTIEKAEELVSRFVAPWLAVPWGCLRKGLLLHCERCIEIDLRGLHRLMPEPQCDHRTFSACL